MSKEAVDTVRQSIRELMAPMFNVARAHGQWFYCSYQSLWFSPDELEALQREGRFVWGPVNWQLRDPKERLSQLRATAETSAVEAQRFAEKLGA